jgi:hypothetical protein
MREPLANTSCTHPFLSHSIPLSVSLSVMRVCLSFSTVLTHQQANPPTHLCGFLPQCLTHSGIEEHQTRKKRERRAFWCIYATRGPLLCLAPPGLLLSQRPRKRRCFSHCFIRFPSPLLLLVSLRHTHTHTQTAASTLLFLPLTS